MRCHDLLDREQGTNIMNVNNKDARGRGNVKARKWRLPSNSMRPAPAPKQAHGSRSASRTEASPRRPQRHVALRNRLVPSGVPSLCSALLRAWQASVGRSKQRQPLRSRGSMDKLDKTLRRPISQQALLVRAANSRVTSACSSVV